MHVKKTHPEDLLKKVHSFMLTSPTTAEFDPEANVQATRFHSIS